MEARDSAVRAASVRAATAVGIAVYLAEGGPGQAGQMFAPEQVLHQNKGSFSVVSKPVFAKKICVQIHSVCVDSYKILANSSIPDFLYLFSTFQRLAEILRFSRNEGEMFTSIYILANIH